MVKLSTILLLLLNCAFAQKAVIIVFEASFFQEPDKNSIIIQRIRKNKIIQINGDRLFNDFYQTTDRRGQTAYVLTNHVKLLTEDKQEKDLKQPDLTDYRISEPLPKNYPFKRERRYRGSLQLDLFSQESQLYPYTSQPTSIKFSGGTRMRFQFTQEPLKWVSKQEPKLYLGGFIQIYYDYNEVMFLEQKYLESTLKYSIGTILSYDLIQKNSYYFVFLSGIGLNIIDLFQIGVGHQSYLYQGIGITPFLSFQYHRKKIFGNFDLVIGPTSTIVFPYRLITGDNQSENSLLKADNSFKKKFDIDWSLSIGIQYSSF